MVLADLLDDPAVAAFAGVDDDDAVVGCTDLAHALETDLDCHLCGHSWFLLDSGRADAVGGASGGSETEAARG